MRCSGSLTGLVLLALSAWRGGLNTIAGWVGVETYPPAVLFAVALLFVLAVLLHYSTVLSKVTDQNVILAQRARAARARAQRALVGAGASRSGGTRSQSELSSTAIAGAARASDCQNAASS